MSLAARTTSSILLARFLGPRHDRAVLDRYGLVRRFFLRQSNTQSCDSLPPLVPRITWVSYAIRPHTKVVTLSYPSLTSQRPRDGWSSRAFHSSSGLREQKKRNAAESGDNGTDAAKNHNLDKPIVSSTESDLHRFDNYSTFFRKLAMSLPHMHRPSREDFLHAATGFWQRMRVRFKWLTIRSFRKYNADDISAFVTWFFMSQTLWLFVGTTTFFSVVFATINSLRLQHHVARAISDYLTSETGITIFFESAIVPKWKDSRISFKNVYITRRPDAAARLLADKNAAHHAARGYDVSNHPSNHEISDEDDEPTKGNLHSEDTNYSMFDLTVDSIDVTLSLARWLEGKGLIADAVVKGVRGVLDRRSVHWDPEHPLDPASFRHIDQPGDFELESLQLEDVLITIHQPDEFRPYTASIFRADIRTFRKQWMFYDFLSAENVVGQFDNCLFSLHKPQSIGRTTDQDLKDGQWARMSRFRIDGVNVDHMQAMTTHEGPISWITSGKLDAVLDIKFPRDHEDGTPFNALIGEIADAITIAATSAVADRIPGQRALAKPPLSAPSDQTDARKGEDDHRKVVVDIDMRFRDLKAAVPMFTNDLSYANNALIRPIVAFMNANRTLVPIHCRVVKDLDDFDGAWTMWETGLMDIIAVKVYEAMAYHVTQANFNRRIKAVSAWSLQMTANAILSTLRSVTDPMAVHLRELYTEGFPYEVYRVGIVPNNAS